MLRKPILEKPQHAYIQEENADANG